MDPAGVQADLTGTRKGLNENPKASRNQGTSMWTLHSERELGRPYEMTKCLLADWKQGPFDFSQTVVSVGRRSESLQQALV